MCPGRVCPNRRMERTAKARGASRASAPPSTRTHQTGEWSAGAGGGWPRVARGDGARHRHVLPEVVVVLPLPHDVRGVSFGVYLVTCSNSRSKRGPMLSQSDLVRFAARARFQDEHLQPRHHARHGVEHVPRAPGHVCRRATAARPALSCPKALVVAALGALCLALFCPRLHHFYLFCV